MVVCMYFFCALLRSQTSNMLTKTQAIWLQMQFHSILFYRQTNQATVISQHAIECQVNRIHFFFFFLIPCTFKLLESFAVMNWWWACCGCQVIQEWGCSIPELVLILGIPTLSRLIPEFSKFLLCSEHVYNVTSVHIFIGYSELLLISKMGIMVFMQSELNSHAVWNKIDGANSGYCPFFLFFL